MNRQSAAAVIDAARFNRTHWLILGWGGRAFYLETPDWADLKPMPVIKALTVDRAVMHVGVARASLAAKSTKVAVTSAT